MSENPAGEDLIARLQLALSELRAEASAAAAALAESGSASDPYATVQVARDGRLVDIAFTDRILTATPPTVSESVMTLYGQARATVQGQGQDGPSSVTAAAVPAGPTLRLPNGDRFLAALRDADRTGTDALLATSSFPHLTVGPGFDELMRARFAAQAAGVSEAQAELARIRTTATSGTVEVEAGATGALLAVRIRAGGPRSGPEKLRQAVLDTLAAAVADARAETGRILAEHGLPDSGRF